MIDFVGPSEQALAKVNEARETVRGLWKQVDQRLAERTSVGRASKVDEDAWDLLDDVISKLDSAADDLDSLVKG